MQLGVQGLLKGPGNSGVSDAQIYAFFHILETLLSFLTPSLTPKTDNKEATWLYAELFSGHRCGSCHGLW